MKTSLKVLIVGDSESDSKLDLMELLRAETPEAISAALAARPSAGGDLP